MFRLNLQRQKFRVGFGNTLPMTDIQGWDDDLKLYKHQNGVDSQVLKILSDHFNFTYDLFDCEGKFGKLLPNGSWNGMIGQLFRNELDFSIGGVALSYDRSKVVNFVYPFTYDQFTFAMARIQKNSNDIHIFIKPFDSIVWMYFIILMIMISILNLISKKIVQKHADLLSISLIIILKQHYHLGLKNQMTNSSKIWILVWSILSSIVLVNYYQSYLSSILTIAKPNEIDSVTKLIESCLKRQIIPYVYQHSYIFVQLKNHRSNNQFNSIIDLINIVPAYTHGIDKILDDKASNRERNVLISSKKKLKLFQLCYHSDRIFIPENNLNSIINTVISSFAMSFKFKYIRHFDYL